MPKIFTNIIKSTYRTIAILAFTAISGFAAGAYAQVNTITDFFKSAPETVIYGIDSNTRLDMLDYFHAGMDRASTNLLEGPCKILEEDSISITFMPAENTICQLFMLEDTKGQQLIGRVLTHATPVLDSQIDFYDTLGQRLASVPLPAPKLANWLTPEGKKQRREVEQAIPFILSTAKYSPEHQTITYTLTLPDYYRADDTPKEVELLRKNLFYKWDGKQFKPF